MERESRHGFNGTVIQVGDIVRIRKGFGSNAYGKVESLCNGQFGYCDVTLTKVGKTRAGWEAGHQTKIFNAFLQGNSVA